MSTSNIGRRVRRDLARAGALIAALAGIACSDATGPSIAGDAHVRVINALFRANETDTAASGIDLLFDSLTTPPSILSLPSGAVSPGDSANGYVSIASGVRKFVARRAGDGSIEGLIYRTSVGDPFIVRQFIPANTYYTLVVGGTVPGTGNILVGVPFTLLSDDAFPGPRIPATGVLQARFRMLNAAPYAAASGAGVRVNMYLVPAGQPQSNIPGTYAPLASSVRYLAASSFFNVNPGTYTLMMTNASGGAVLQQQTVTIAEGEVRTFVLLSTAAAPGAANLKITNLLDHTYAH